MDYKKMWHQAKERLEAYKQKLNDERDRCADLGDMAASDRCADREFTISEALYVMREVAEEAGCASDEEQHSHVTCKEPDCRICQEMIDHGLIEACDGCDRPCSQESDGLTLMADGRTLCHACIAKEPNPQEIWREYHDKSALETAPQKDGDRINAISPDGITGYEQSFPTAPAGDLMSGVPSFIDGGKSGEGDPGTA